MGKVDKDLEKLKRGRIPGEVPIQIVKRILGKYFSKNQIKNYKGSHLIIHDERLDEYSNAGDHVTIPVKSGKSVKRGYIKKKLLPLIEYMKSIEW